MAMPQINDTMDLPQADLRAWLTQTATTYDCTYLLAHAEDGIIWGHFGKGRLTTSYDVFGPSEQGNINRTTCDADIRSFCPADIRPATLWEARLFGLKSEVLLWRSNGAWQARVIQDTSLKAYDDYLIEEQMLWGDHAECRVDGFTLLADGSEGLRHAVPIDVNDALFIDQGDETRKRYLRPVRLSIHHYINFDTSGNAHIALSRLVNLYVSGA